MINLEKIWHPMKYKQIEFYWIINFVDYFRLFLKVFKVFKLKSLKIYSAMPKGSVLNLGEEMCIQFGRRNMY